MTVPLRTPDSTMYISSWLLRPHLSFACSQFLDDADRFAEIVKGRAGTEAASGQAGKP